MTSLSGQTLSLRSYGLLPESLFSSQLKFLKVEFQSLPVIVCPSDLHHGYWTVYAVVFFPSQGLIFPFFFFFSGGEAIV